MEQIDAGLAENFWRLRNPATWDSQVATNAQKRAAVNPRATKANRNPYCYDPPLEPESDNQVD